MNNLSHEGRALFQRARQDFEPTHNERERNARALAVRLGISAGVLAGTLSTASGAGASAAAAAGKSGASLALLVSKSLAVGLLIGGSVAAGVVAVQAGSAPAPPEQAAPSAARFPGRLSPPRKLGTGFVPGTDSVTPAPTTRPSLIRPTERPSSSGLKTSSSSKLDTPSTPPAHSANVAEEARLVRRAEEELRAGSPRTALALLEQLAREQPSGVFMEERSVERIDSLCQLGQTQQAQAEATRFLQATPSSPLAKRVQQSCAVLRSAPR